jgi:uncharacterized protein (TIGR02118 family)
MTVKLVAFFRRRTGVSVGDFQRHWRTQHAQLVIRQAGLRRYVQNHALESAYRKREPDYDGVAEAWFDDVDAMRALAQSAEYAAVRADERCFIDAKSMGVVLTDEVVIAPGPVPAGAVKSIAFLRKRADLSPEQFQAHWRTQHAALGARVPGARRYVQCHARLGIYRSGRAPVFDGIPMSWFDDEDALRAAGRSEELARTRADEPNFLAPGRLPAVAVREIEIDVSARGGARP